MLHSAAWTKGGEKKRKTNKTKAAGSHISKWGILITSPGQGYVQQSEKQRDPSPNHVHNCSKSSEHPVLGNTKQTRLCTEPEQQHDPNPNHVHNCSKPAEHPVTGNTNQTGLCPAALTAKQTQP